MVYELKNQLATMIQSNLRSGSDLPSDDSGRLNAAHVPLIHYQESEPQTYLSNQDSARVMPDLETTT
jgi:hypothetical protein